MEIPVKELFEKGRSCYRFADRKVPHELLHEIYDLMKMGPTSYNCCPLRIVFVEGEEAKKKLLECAMEGNIPAITQAPMTALFAYDMNFTDKFTKLLPTMPEVAGYFKEEKKVVETAFRNSTLQAAYFMMAARSKGLVCGPMSGFYADKLEAAFFAGTGFKPNFICNLGYPEGEPKYPRLPRLDFAEVCKIV